MPDGDPPTRAHPWLSEVTLAAALVARRRVLRQPGSCDGGSRAVREVILAHHPALPFTMISEAVAYVLTLE